MAAGTGDGFLWFPVLAAVAVVSPVVGGLRVLNIMLVSVTERKREIGIRVKLGARTFDVMFQFLTEAVLVCFIGGLLGVFVGLGGGQLLSTLAGWRGFAGIDLVSGRLSHRNPL